MRPNVTIDPDRMALLPPRHWHSHEFCFHLHDQMAELLVQYESSGAHRWVVDAFQKAVPTEMQGEVDSLALLQEKELLQYYKHHVVSHLVLGLTSDMLHFLYEALCCFEKRKFSVGYALLRKPLKENLLFLSWLLSDQDEFVSRLEVDAHAQLKRVLPESRERIFRGAIEKLATRDAFDAGILQEMIYSKANAGGLEPIWQRATHLVTSQGELLRTEDLNLNFIFADAASDELYEPLYRNLPYVLLYAVQVSLECFACILRYNEQTVSRLIISTMGCFETLLGTERSMTKMLSSKLRGFLNCLQCGASLRLTRQNAVDMYLREQLKCHKCGLTSPFPLYWILATAKVQIERTNGAREIIQGR